MVTVVKNPQGHKIVSAGVAATIIDTSGDALVIQPYHPFSTANITYITSDIDEYNGFWYVTYVDYQSFKISEHSAADFVEFYQEADIEYFLTQSHEWTSIFLPIVYKCTNDRWPTNSIDTPRTIVSASDDNGFTQLNLSGVLRSYPVRMLEFVKIESASDDDLNNVWQIVEVISTTSITISLPYSIDNSFSTATIQYYYSNYQVRVKVWAGLNPGHPWASKKPYEEMAELSLTPDENNEVMFSISDYIKSKVQIKNNLLLFSLPLNLDAFTGFYIQTAESFDESDNYSLITNESTFADDDLEGYAVAGKLPFKNTYAGDYADYVFITNYPALWLTNATRLLAVEDLYFDISFIKNVTGPFTLIIDKYLGTDLNTTQSISYADQGIGVYRIPITPSAVYDSFCVRVRTDTHEEEVLVPPDPFDLSEFVQTTDSSISDWVLGYQPFGSGVNINVLYISFPTTIGVPYKFNYRFVANNVLPGTHNLAIATYDAVPSGISYSIIHITANGVYEGSVIITPVANGLYFGTNFTGSSSMDITVEMLSVGEDTTETVTVDGETVTEEICIDILEQCEAQQGFTEEDRRLLEDGDFRLLE